MENLLTNNFLAFAMVQLHFIILRYWLNLSTLLLTTECLNYHEGNLSTESVREIEMDLSSLEVLCALSNIFSPLIIGLSFLPVISIVELQNNDLSPSLHLFQHL